MAAGPVDAVLGRQTRPHKDVDVIIGLSDVPKLQVILGERGFTVREGIVPHSFVLTDSTGSSFRRRSSVRKPESGTA